MKNENTLTLLCTDSHDDSSASGVRKPVRTIRNRLMPSTPMWYWMPNTGIHARCSTNW